MSYWRAEDSLDWEDEILSELARKNKTTKSDMLERLERRTYPVWIKVFAVLALGLVAYGCFGAEKYFMGSVYRREYMQADTLVDKIRYLEKALRNTPDSEVLIVEEVRLLMYLSRGEDAKYVASGLPMLSTNSSDLNSIISKPLSLRSGPQTLDEMVLANWMMDNLVKERRRAGS
jgi:hypothetical protein